jgi:hypothetical protein
MCRTLELEVSCTCFDPRLALLQVLAHTCEHLSVCKEKLEDLEGALYYTRDSHRILSALGASHVVQIRRASVNIALTISKIVKTHIQQEQYAVALSKILEAEAIVRCALKEDREALPVLAQVCGLMARCKCRLGDMEGAWANREEHDMIVSQISVA